MQTFEINSFFTKNEKDSGYKNFFNEISKISDFLKSNNASIETIQKFNNLVTKRHSNVLDNLKRELDIILSNDSDFTKKHKTKEEVRKNYILSVTFDKDVVGFRIEKKGFLKKNDIRLEKEAKDFDVSRSAGVAHFNNMRNEASQGIIDNILLAVNTIKDELKVFISSQDPSSNVGDIDDLWDAVSEDLENENSDIRRSMLSNISSPTEGIADYLKTRFNDTPEKSDNADYQSKLLAASRTIMAMHLINEREDLGKKRFSDLVSEAENRDEPGRKYFTDSMHLSEGVSLLESASVHLGFDAKAGNILFDQNIELSPYARDNRTRNAVENICTSAEKYKLFRPENSNEKFHIQAQEAFDKLKKILEESAERTPDRIDSGNNLYTNENNMLDLAAELDDTFYDEFIGRGAENRSMFSKDGLFFIDIISDVKYDERNLYFGTEESIVDDVQKLNDITVVLSDKLDTVITIDTDLDSASLEFEDLDIDELNDSVDEIRAARDDDDKGKEEEGE